MTEPVRILAAPDPVDAFWTAHRAGSPIALPTSGTTAAPRTVVRSTTSWSVSFGPYADLTGIGPGAQVWIPGPLTATMNLYAAVQAAWVGAEVTDTLEAASHLQLTPSVLARLLSDGADLEGRTVVVAGAALPAVVAQAAATAGIRLAHYYGAAELSFVAWGVDELRPFPGVEVAVRSGTIWARSPYLAERVEPSSPAFRRDVDGWATVGDRGRWTATGREPADAAGSARPTGAGPPGPALVVYGRDEVAVTAGLTVVLADVEAALQAGADGDVVVVGVPHPELGTVVTAVLTDPADRARVRTIAAGLGPGRPRRWVHLAALPLTSAGKVDRTGLSRRLTRPSA